MKSTFAAVLALAVSCVTLAAEPRIDRIAPENSVFIVSMKSFATTMERAKSTKLWELWQSPEMADARAELTKGYEESMKQMFQDLGLEEGEMPWPTGAIGMAAFPTIDEDLGVPQPGFILFADYGDNADKASEIVDAALKKGHDQGEITVDENDVLGRKVITIKPTEQAKKARHAAEPGNELEGGEHGELLENDPEDFPQPDDFFGDAKEVNFVRDGNVMMLSTDLATLTRAFEVSDGAVVPSVGDSASFQRVVSDIGESDVTAVVMLDHFSSMLGPEGQELATWSPIITSAIGNVEAIGLGARLDSPTAMLDMTYRIFMPDGTAGLTSLLDKQTPRAPVPTFVPSDAVAYNTFNFEFKDLPDVVRQFLNANAPMLGINPEEEMMSIEPIMQQVTSALGSEVHTFMTVSTPIDLDSMKSCYAIRCDKPADINTVLATYAPMLQMQPRDFLGNTLYTMDPAMMGMMMGAMEPISIGVGGEHVFIGSTSLVEQSMRALQGGAAANLAENPVFKHAAAALPNEPAVGWGYQNLVPMIEAVQEIAKVAEARMIENAREFDPEYAKELEADRAKHPPSPLEKLNARVLQRYIGPISWRVTSGSDGFTGKSYLLEPAGAK